MSFRQAFVTSRRSDWQDLTAFVTSGVSSLRICNIAATARELLTLPEQAAFVTSATLHERDERESFGEPNDPALALSGISDCLRASRKGRTAFVTSVAIPHSAFVTSEL